MELITKRSVIRFVAERWSRQYPDAQHGRDKPEIGRRLSALDLETVEAEEVDAIIGNSSWTEVPKCGECGLEDPPAVVQVGEPPDYESRTAFLCLSCARAAADLFTLTVEAPNDGR